MKSLRYTGKGSGSLLFRTSNGARRNIRAGEVFEVDNKTAAMLLEDPMVIEVDPDMEPSEEQVIAQPPPEAVTTPEPNAGDEPLATDESGDATPAEPAKGEDDEPGPEEGVNPNVGVMEASGPNTADTGEPPDAASGVINITDLPASAKKGGGVKKG